MPELIIKGWEGLNLANFKELFIGTVNVTNFVQMLDSSCWQFFVHGQGAVPCLTRLQSAFVEVPSKVESVWTTFGARFKAGQRRGQKIANCLEVDFPAQRYAKFPRMQWGQILAPCLLG